MFDMTSPLAHAELSLFCDSFNSTPVQVITLLQVLDEIRTGRYQSKIDRLRQILAREGKVAYDRAKAYLPAVTFGGVFVPSRGNAHLQQHSGLVLGDMDSLSNIIAAKRAICSDRRTACVFASPSAIGLKAAVHVPVVTDDITYKHAWQTVKAEYERLYGACWDPSGKDVSRLCYTSHDPDLYINVNAEVFDVPPAPAPEPQPQPQRPSVPPSHTNHQDYAERAIRSATEMIQQAPLGVRHHTRLRAARLLGGYVAGEMISEERAYGALAQALVGYTEHLEKALKTVEDGLRYGQEHPIKIEDLETERQAWLDQHRSWPRVSHQKRPTDDPWAGRRTLPLRPYGGLRMPREVRRG